MLRHPELKVSTQAHTKHLGRHVALEFRVTQRTSCRTRISSRAARPGPTPLLSPDHDDCLGNGCSRNMCTAAQISFFTIVVTVRLVPNKKTRTCLVPNVPFSRPCRSLAPKGDRFQHPRRHRPPSLRSPRSAGLRTLYYAPRHLPGHAEHIKRSKRSVQALKKTLQQYLRLYMHLCKKHLARRGKCVGHGKDNDQYRAPCRDTSTRSARTCS